MPTLSKFVQYYVSTLKGCALIAQDHSLLSSLVVVLDLFFCSWLLLYSFFCLLWIALESVCSHGSKIHSEVVAIGLVGGS